MLELDHPVLERIRRLNDQGSESPLRLELDDDETRRLAEILDRGFDPPAALIACLRRIVDSKRKAPELSWADASD